MAEVRVGVMNYVDSEGINDESQNCQIPQFALQREVLVKTCAR